MALAEKRLPETLADSLAERELDSHHHVLSGSNRRRLTLFADFFLFNVMKLTGCATG